ncbi:MAG: DEAD/DEAH box helicase [Candidatus Nanohaloarchaea archaeon]
MEFSDLNVSEDILENLEQQGITSPTEVQEKSIPVVRAGKDVMVESETGSGKTLAFSIPIMEDVEGDGTQALVLSPTRELAKQINQEIENAAGENVETVTIYGGVSYEPQIEGARTANIVVGTPGRILDLLKQGKLEVGDIEYFVLDEADRMMDMGFQDELEQIIDFTPEDRQNLLFGATIPGSLRKMCDRYSIDPEEVRIKKSEHTRNLEEKYIDARSNTKLSTLYTLLKERERDLSIVFCRTKNTTRWLSDMLEKNGIDAHELNGDMSQNQRERTMERFENGEFRVVVATDVAARGLDIDNVTHVFNYDVPDDADTYTHRVGRAGRQGAAGEAITILEKKDHSKWRRIKNRKDGISRMDKDELDLKDVRT